MEFRNGVVSESDLSQFEAAHGHKDSPGAGLYARIGKRLMDVILAISLLPLLGPLILCLSLSVRRDGGPGFFAHTRIGRNGQPFRCWKIRTMVVGAEERLRDYLAENPEAAEEWHREFKLRDDPRITRWGQFLRKTSLDELPQLWNVLKGEMSFVGPRPVIRDELTRYGVHRKSYEAMRPGVTGLWQVSGRNDVDYAERVRMDVAYQRKVGLAMDCAILLRTIRSVLRATGR